MEESLLLPIEYTFKVRCDASNADAIYASLIDAGNSVKDSLTRMGDPINDVVLISDGDWEYFTDER